MNINEMTNEQIKEIARVYKIRRSELQRIYHKSYNENGKTHEITIWLWEKYIQLDDESDPYQVKANQIEMQEQIDNMSEDDLQSFYSIID